MKYSNIVLVLVSIGLVAAISAQTFPSDIFKTVFAKGVVFSTQPTICPGSSSNWADVAFYSDLPNKRIRTVMGCDSRETTTLVRCDLGLTANIFCNGDQCVCRTNKVSNCDTFLNVNLTSLSYNGQHDYFGVQKADQWQTNFGPSGNETSIFIYTNPSAFLGYEIVPGMASIPAIQLVMKRWDISQPDSNVFDLPDGCTSQPSNIRSAVENRDIISSMLPLDMQN